MKCKNNVSGDGVAQRSNLWVVMGIKIVSWLRGGCLIFTDGNESLLYGNHHRLCAGVGIQFAEDGGDVIFNGLLANV